MLDRKNCPKILVWQDGSSDKFLRIVFDIMPDGSCLAVDEGYEKLFLDNEPFEICHWDNYEEITEPKYRAFKNGEMPEEWRDYWYREEGSSACMSPNMYDKFTNKQLYFDEWFTNDFLFKYFEVQKTPGGEWGIVGVEE